MKTKMIVAKIMVLSMAISALPVSTLHAAELAEPAELQEEQTEDSGEELSDHEKAVGRNGVLYDDVLYLSAKNVAAMEAETQEMYYDICDSIVSAKEDGIEMEDTVLAVDQDGDLYFYCYIPLRVLDSIEDEMLSGLVLPVNEGETPTDGGNNGEKEKKQEGADGEPEGDKDKQEGVDGEDKKDQDKEENTGGEDKKEQDKEEGTDGEDKKEQDKEEGTDGEDKKEQDKEEGIDGEDQTDDKDKQENVGGEDKKEQDKEENAGGENKEDQDKDEDAGAGEEDKTHEEPDEDEQEGADGEAEEDPDEEEESYVLTEENINRIPEMEEETFEIAESVKVERTINLEEDGLEAQGFFVEGSTFDTQMSTPDYFVDQLNTNQKKYYDSAKNKLTKGSNSFSFSTTSNQSMNTVMSDICHALSAVVLNYPDKTDWFAKPGGFSYKAKLSGSNVNITVLVEKSKYWSSSLDSAAAARIREVVAQAQQYAAEQYAGDPTFGIVKYFDEWICENGYYENAGTIVPSGDNDDHGRVYYNCHSAYGILSEGYGVCESYAKALSRLLDAVSIPNIYVVGDAGGGHAWNFVQMTNGAWYLQDSTWNDSTNPAQTYSSGRYLLVKEDGRHQASGCQYVNETPDFSFPERSGGDYPRTAGGSDQPTASKLVISQTECNLQPKGSATLSFQISGAGDANSGGNGVWSSSNEKVAKVNQNGVITAVAAGRAVIRVMVGSMSATCIVNVDQVKAIVEADTGKTSDTVSLGINNAKINEKNVVVRANMGASPHTLEQYMNLCNVTPPVITNSNRSVASAEVASVKGNDINVSMQALAVGKTDVKLQLAGRTVTLKVSVGQLITEEMFEVTWPAAVMGAAGSRTTPYTGKAIKPTVKKKAGDAYKPVTFKSVYVNNKNAGVAKVIIKGTGKYGGTIEYPFTITPIDISGADFSKALKSKVYNGGSNPPATTVKVSNKTLKAGRDYDILYNGKTESEMRQSDVDPIVIPAGSYTISIRGKGNYTGVARTTQLYQVTSNSITKVSVSCAASARYTGAEQGMVKVKIGKNQLPDTDYTITWYKGQGKTRNRVPMQGLPKYKGKYTAVVKVRGGNLTTTAKKQEITKNFTIR